MADEDIESAEAVPGAGVSDEVTDASVDPEAAPAEGVPDGPEDGKEGRSRSRAPLFAAVRVVIVLAIAAGVYQQVIPVHHVVRTRLARLVVTRPGVEEFNAKPVGAAEQKAANLGLAVLKSVAKTSPDQTGVYSVEWRGTGKKNAEDVLGLIAVLLPTDADAQQVMGELKTQQLSANAYASESLSRSSTFVVPGIPGSNGSFYAPTKKATNPDSLAAVVFRTGNVVGVAEGIKAKGAVADAKTAAVMEFKHLEAVAPGFTLKTVTRPALASGLWIGGSVVVALVAGGGPVLARRIRRRRQRRRQEELDRMIVVRGQTITKRRRVSGT